MSQKEAVDPLATAIVKEQQRRRWEELKSRNRLWSGRLEQRASNAAKGQTKQLAKNQTQPRESDAGAEASLGQNEGADIPAISVDPVHTPDTF